MIPITDLKDYAKNIPTEAYGEFIIVKRMGNNMNFYYTGRDKEYQSLKRMIELETDNILMNIKVNGSVVNKVIGTKDKKDSIKNYVWYSGYLWQVLETNVDGIKMVMDHSITSISYGPTTNYKNSWVRKWLNDVSGDTVNYPNPDDLIITGVFYNKLNRRDLIVDTKMCLDAASDVIEDNNLVMSDTVRSRLLSFTPINNCNDVFSDKVGLMTLEDYVFAYDGTLTEYDHNSTFILDEIKRKKGGTMGYNFLDTDELTWLVTPSDSSGVMWVTQYYNPGYISKNHGEVNTYGLSVRPVITLKDTVKVESGTGVKSDPYIIAGQTILNNNSSLTLATVGEYIFINEENNPYESNKSIKENVKYRIIGIDDYGIKVQRESVLTKLPNNIAINSGIYTPYYTYYDTNAPTTEWCHYDSHTNTWYLDGCSNNNYMKNVGTGNFELEKGNSLGYFLNDASNGFFNWISDDYKLLIKEISYKLPVGGYKRDATKLFLLTEEDNNDANYHATIYDGEYKGRVTLPSWGDILSGNDLNISYWYQNRWPGSTANVSILRNSGTGDGTYSSNVWFAVRPVFYLKDSVKIKSGHGTSQSPYQLNV